MVFDKVNLTWKNKRYLIGSFFSKNHIRPISPASNHPNTPVWHFFSMRFWLTEQNAMLVNLHLCMNYVISAKGYLFFTYLSISHAQQLKVFWRKIFTFDIIRNIIPQSVWRFKGPPQSCETAKTTKTAS